MAAVCEVGILFADVVGSSRIYEQLGDTRAHAVINQCFRIMGECVQAHCGVVVKTIGDELMAAFNAAHQPFSCAVDIRRRFAEMPALSLSDKDIPVAVRIGFHFGSAMQEREDFFGDTVNIAARMVGLAKANQILTTGDVLDLLPESQKAMAVEFGQIEVRGRAVPVRIAQIPLEAPQQNATVLRFGRGAEAVVAGSRIRFVLADRDWVAPASAHSIVFGRDPASDVLLKSPHVSRSHATIERRRNKFFLVDHSTNGTLLIIGAQRPIMLLREEFGLAESGRIAFGRTPTADGDMVDFFIT